MRDLSTTALAALALALSFPASAQDQHSKARPPATGLEQGFFRPTPDPALTSLRPAPAAAPDARAAPVMVQTEPRPAVDSAEEIREAEEHAVDRAERIMDRAEREHDRARAEAAMTATAPAQAVSAGSPPQ